ncbi:MAG TPA: amidase, partial [Alphaproteobacteria bacterium]
TADMPTECGSPLCAGRAPRQDAAVVAQLRQAGAIVLGKTVTTEFAFLEPSRTCNPLDPSRTPGGSSSGSAAAVAAGMVPLALGTQTGGSTIRPAAFCGVYGYKPSHGLISRRGVLGLSRALDHVGVFARTLADLALLAEQLMAFDPADPDMHPRPRPRLSDFSTARPPAPPKLAFVKSPAWPDADGDTRAAFADLVGALGGHIEEVALPPIFDEALACHRLIAEADMALSLEQHYQAAPDRLSAILRTAIESGRQHRAVDYNRAVARIAAFDAALDALFAGFDAVLTPAAAGVAPPRGVDAGSAAFCSIWTLCGTPAINLPILRAPSGLPIGAQLVGAKGDDARLFRVANWLTVFVDNTGAVA